MKKIIFTVMVFAFLANINAASGQTNDNTIVNNNSAWDIVYIQYEDETGIVNIPRHIEKIYFEGDSVADNKTYKKVFSCMDDNHPLFTGLIREENLKTRYIFAGQTQEYLLYDFSVELNDIVELYCPNIQSPLIYRVHAVDFMNVNGVPKKRIELTYPDSETIMDIWVENLGSLFNFITLDQMPGFGKILLNFYSDGICLYHNPDYDSWLSLTSKTPRSDFHFFIRSEILNIQFDIPFGGEISLHETGGKLLHHKLLSNRSQYGINMSGFAPGLYLLSLKADKGKKRIVKINYMK